MKSKADIKKMLYWLPASLWLIVIFLMSSVRVDFKGDNINLVSRVLLMMKEFLYKRRNTCPVCVFISENLDRFYHAFEYFIFTVLVFYALKKTRNAGIKENSVLTALIVLTIGIIDELHQIFVPTRYCSFFDLVADGSGMLLMIVFIAMFELTFRRKNAV